MEIEIDFVIAASVSFIGYYKVFLIDKPDRPSMGDSIFWIVFSDKFIGISCCCQTDKFASLMGGIEGCTQDSQGVMVLSRPIGRSVGICTVRVDACIREEIPAIAPDCKSAVIRLAMPCVFRIVVVFQNHHSRF